MPAVSTEQKPAVAWLSRNHVLITNIGLIVRDKVATLQPATCIDLMKMAAAKLATVCLLLARCISPEALSAIVSQGAGPPIRDVKHAPEQPRASEAVVISARLPGLAAPKSVVLRYQLVDPGKYIALPDAEYKTKWVSVPMNDEGRTAM